MEMLDDEWGVLYNHLSDKIELHADVEEMLSAFANNNLNQIILSAFKTNEITKYARKFSIENYFDDILGTQNIVMESKTIRGRRYIQKHGFAPKQTLYIGDTVHDYNTARDLGVDCILFSGGQQSPKLLKQCGVPVYNSFADITKRRNRSTTTPSPKTQALSKTPRACLSMILILLLMVPVWFSLQWIL